MSKADYGLNGRQIRPTKTGCYASIRLQPSHTDRINSRRCSPDVKPMRGVHGPSGIDRNGTMAAASFMAKSQ